MGSKVGGVLCMAVHIKWKDCDEQQFLTQLSKDYNLASRGLSSLTGGIQPWPEVAQYLLTSRA